MTERPDSHGTFAPDSPQRAALQTSLCPNDRDLIGYLHLAAEAIEEHDEGDQGSDHGWKSEELLSAYLAVNIAIGKVKETAELLSLLQRWAALDAGAWLVERHADEKARLLADTRAAIAKAENKSNPAPDEESQ